MVFTAKCEVNKLNYKPYWQRIIILAVILNLILIFVSAPALPETEEKPRADLQEIEWVETETPEVATAETATEISPPETFAEIVLPPLEIPHTDFPPLPELNTEPPPPVQPVEEIQEAEPPPPPVEEKAETNPADKLKVIVKVYPKDLIEQFIKSGIVKEKLTFDGEKIVLAVTITTEGKVRNVEILQGGGNDERGKLINLVVSTAAQSWIFEPYLDEEGNPQELKTQIEFTPEDF